MTDIQTRVENAKKLVTGNESLLDMLDADAASELYNLGLDLAVRIAQATNGMDDAAADQYLEARMKALRQFLRTIGNWAAGKYDVSGRAGLSEKLNEQVKMVIDMESLKGLQRLLDLVDDKNNTPRALILKIKESLVVPR